MQLLTDNVEQGLPLLFPDGLERPLDGSRRLCRVFDSFGVAARGLTNHLVAEGQTIWRLGLGQTGRKQMEKNGVVEKLE